MLLGHGADTNARKDDNTTKLHEAARSGSGLRVGWAVPDRSDRSDR